VVGREAIMRFDFLPRNLTVFVAALALLSETSWAQTTSCDVNGDGSVNVVDVQLLTNMEIGVATCTANIGGVLQCSDPARQVVIKAALGQGCHFIQLSWTASTSSGVTGYNIYRGTASGAESTTINTGGPVTGTSFTDVNTVSGTTYYYVIKATNGSTESAPSTEISATAL
jgi:hypothetical protein